MSHRGTERSFTHDTGRKREVETIVKRNYAIFSSCYGLARPNRGSISSILDLICLYSGVGVLGCHGTVFCRGTSEWRRTPRTISLYDGTWVCSFAGSGSEAGKLFCFPCSAVGLRCNEIQRILQPVALCGGQCQEVIVDDRFQEWGNNSVREICAGLWGENREYWSEV